MTLESFLSAFFARLSWTEPTEQLFLGAGAAGEAKKQQVQQERALEASGPAPLCPSAFSLATSGGSICSHHAKDSLS